MANNILFIGGAGFIGSNIISEITKNNTYRVFVLEPIFAPISRLNGLPVKLFRGSISDLDSIETILKVNKISKVVHLVSTMVPGCNYNDYKQEFENVIFPTIRLMQLCSKMKVQFVYFSSGGTVYGERKPVVPFLETDPKEPISYYGLSKQMIENSILFENRVSNLQYLILRPSNPYGPGQNINGRQGLIAVALGKVLSGEPITIWGDGSSIRDYIYINDLAKIVADLLEANTSNLVVNIGSGKGYSIKQVLNIINNIVDEEIQVEYTPSRKNDVSNMILDTTLLKTLVQVNNTPIELGIKQFYEYEKKRAKNG